eukprot:GHVP01039585.1.p1 GENE.GHVP01039585.1~~GHVP01039585.1.p1  ORF type:complete len:938 (+),score=221.61 GHVP01039585.1:3365-6178(+)
MLRMIRSPSFDMYLHMHYLFHKSESGVHDYLVNELFTRTDEEIHDYLPQLCQLSMAKFKQSPLARFLLHLASKKMHVALKAQWIFQSMVDDKLPKGLAESASEMCNETEMAVVNQKPMIGGWNLVSQDSLPENCDSRLFQRRRMVHKLDLTQAVLGANMNPADSSWSAPGSIESDSNDDRAILEDQLSPLPIQSPVGKSFPSSPVQGNLPLNSLHAPLTLPTPITPPSLINKDTSPSLSISTKNAQTLPFILRLSQSLRSRKIEVYGKKYMPEISKFLEDPLETKNLENEAESADVPREFQHFFWKRRRCDYHNQISQFMKMMIEVSNVLATDYVEKSHKTTLLELWLPGLNEWLFLRRCAVAAAEATFTMTGLIFPLLEFGADPESQKHSVQLIRFVTEECRVISTKKRAPVILVFEVADLDEDISEAPAILQLETRDFASTLDIIKKNQDTQKQEETSFSASLGLESHILDPFSDLPADKSSSTNLLRKPTWQSLYVYECILQEIREQARRRSMTHAFERKTGSPMKHIKRAVGVDLIEEEEDLESLSSTPVRIDESDFGPSPNEGGTKESEITNRVDEFDPPKSPPKNRSSISSEGEILESPRSADPSPDAPISGTDSSASNKISELKQERAALSEEEKIYQAKVWRGELWGELWEDRKTRIRRNSAFGTLNTWDLGCLLVKGKDDLRQELLASQLIREFHRIFQNKGLPLYLHPYEILVTGNNSGLVQYVPDTQSIDALKRKFGASSLNEVFEFAFYDNLEKARQNFVRSHAANSLVGYLLQIRDRHNGNILLDAKGHVVHIDFGYMLTNYPGGVLAVESAPFKLTQEFIDCMGGEKSEGFKEFKKITIEGFLALRQQRERITLLVQMMVSATRLPCFQAGPEVALQQLEDRFMRNLTEEELIGKVEELISTSANNMASRAYDTYQRMTNGIL